jgi:hypothetical protein
VVSNFARNIDEIAPKAVTLYEISFRSGDETKISSGMSV